MKSGFTQSSPSFIGVRQGDTLSPDLFKLFYLKDFILYGVVLI